MVFGLEMVFRLGQRIWDPDVKDRSMVAALMGLALMAAGWLGWVAGHALQAAVSRQREYLADARAVQWTRSKDGLGGVLRKVLGTQSDDEESRQIGSPMQHLLLVSTEGDRVAHWLDSHPTLEQRIRRIYGRPMGPLPLERADEVGPHAQPDPSRSVHAPNWTLT
jgi:Zn-dependent protease with chaperone function